MSHKQYFLLVSFFLCFSIAAYAQDSTLIDFSLKDQFDQEYSHESWPGRVLIFIGSDKDGSEFNGVWGKAITDSLIGHPNFGNIQMVGLSDLRGVPFFIKGYVRGRFPKDKNQWVLMDWKGVFPKAYQFKEGMSNILIFDSQRKLAYQTAVRTMDNLELMQIVKATKNTIKNE